MYQRYAFQKKDEIIERINALLDSYGVVETAILIHAALLDSKAEHSLTKELMNQINIAENGTL